MWNQSVLNSNSKKIEECFLEVKIMIVELEKFYGDQGDSFVSEVFV